MVREQQFQIWHLSGVGMMTMQAVALRQQSAAHQIPGAHL
jgi:hypothetical protein